MGAPRAASPSVACFGDVSGHLEPFLAGLAQVGVRPGEPWPEGLAVVQVGDLVHKGPDSDRVVEIVAMLGAAAPPGAWAQLAGNHEAVHVGGVGFRCDAVSGATEHTLAAWHDDGSLVAAAVIAPPGGGVPALVTHAGLTAPWWAQHCGADADATATAASLNRLWRADPGAFGAGVMLGGGLPRPRPEDASPLWAHPSSELWPSWAARRDPAPFHQVHGHASAYWWDRDEWSRPLPSAALREAARVDRAARRVRVVIATRRITGIDPGYGRYARRPLLPLVVPGTLSVPR